MPIHPMLVHLPIAFAIFGPFFFLVLLIVIRRRPEARSIWKWTILWQVLMCASIYAAMATGENDEDKAAKFAGPDVVHAHEEAAELLFIVSLLALLPALAGVKKSGFEFGARVVAVAMQCVLLALCVNAARLGGEIVYVHGGADAHVKKKKSAPAASPPNSKPSP